MSGEQPSSLYKVRKAFTIYFSWNGLPILWMEKAYKDKRVLQEEKSLIITSSLELLLSSSNVEV